MKTFLMYLIAFTAGLKETAKAVNEAQTPEELTEKLKKQIFG